MKLFLMISFLFVTVSVYSQTLLRSKDKNPILIDTTIKPALFEVSFINDSTYQDISTGFKYRTIDIGKIKIESGWIVAGDAADLHNNIAFVQHFPKGEFPVQVSYGWETDMNVGVAIYTRIKFSNQPVKQWEYALKPGMKDYPLADTGALRCYSWTFSGTSVLIDQKANLALNNKRHKEWSKLLLRQTEYPEYPQTAHLLKFDGHSLAAVFGEVSSSCYRYYIGYDKNGKICRLLFDLGTIALHLSAFK